MCIKYLTFVFLTLVLTTNVLAKIIKVNDPGWLYTGRIDFSQQRKAYLSWPGSSIKGQISGKKLVLFLEGESGQNYLNIIINNNHQHPYVLAVSKGAYRYDLSHLLNKPNSVVEIFKRTDGNEAGVYFLGIEVEEGVQLGPKPIRPVRRIAFFGDSITSGAINETADNLSDSEASTADNNSYLSYSAMTARALKAEFHSTSLTGIGFMISWIDFTMSDYFDQLSAKGNNNTVWDFTKWQADLVVINLGQNDFQLIDLHKRLSPLPSDQQIVDNYVMFSRKLLDVYPNAKFIFTIGSMNATQTRRWPGLIQEGVKQLKKQYKGRALSYLEFPFTGYKDHPRVHQHANNSKLLTAHIQSVMEW